LPDGDGFLPVPSHAEQRRNGQIQQATAYPAVHKIAVAVASQYFIQDPPEGI
jgi:hypothetical protein